MGEEEFDNLLNRLNANGIEGLHTRKEREWLFELAGKAKGNIVEIGSFLGHSTIIMAKGTNGGTVYAIDPHIGICQQGDEDNSAPVGDTWKAFNTNIAFMEVSHKIQPLKMTSEAAVANWDKPIDLLFIDGSHRYKDVKKDFLLWKEHLGSGSVVVFHDCWQYGPRRVITELLIRDPNFGKFKLTTCCMFWAVYRPVTPGKSSRRIWLTVFRLRALLRNKFLRGKLLAVARWVGR